MARGAQIASGRSTGWASRVQDRTGAFGPTLPCSVLGPARTIGKPWPSTVYRGIAHDPSQLFMEKVSWIAGTVASTWFMAAITLALAESPGDPGRRVESAWPRGVMRVALPIPAAADLDPGRGPADREFLARATRVDPLPLAQGLARYVFLAAAALALALSPSPAIALAARVVRLPRTRAWPLLIGAVLVVCGVLRIYKLDFQPLDDDEYASCQGVLAIASVGTPKFVPDGVYYTRSPFYHYFIGGIVWLFGNNLWSMRLPTAMFGIATALMIYRMGAKLLKRPWVGFGAMCFFTIHPFAIFSAHLVRFYQQQQFCSLVAVYWFCEGFVGKPSQKHRYLTTFAFFFAVISQEITAIMAFQLLLGLFLFGREAGWPANIKLAVIVVLAMAWIVMDLVVFQTWCLTRTEGVSPNVEASIKPHFWDPFNLVSIFLGYSRLHVGPSLALLCATPLLVIRGGRVVWAARLLSCSPACS